MALLLHLDGPNRSGRRQLSVTRGAAVRGASALALAAAVPRPLRAADKLSALLRAAKSETGLTIIAGSTTFGGQPGVAALNEAFAKRFGFDPHFVLTPGGPTMAAIGSRLALEFQGNRTASTALYHGPLRMFITLSGQGVLERVDWDGTFPWITREMLISPDGSGVLVRSGLSGIVYSPKILDPAKAPKRYEDLIDPHASDAWRGRLAMPVDADWLTELVPIWGFERARDFATKLTAVSTGRLRNGELQTLIDGEFAIMANSTSALELKWEWATKGAALDVVFGSTPIICEYLQIGVPKNSPCPNLATLFAGFLISPEAQAIVDKYGGMGSHFVPTTRVYALVRQNRLQLIAPRTMYAFQSDPRTRDLLKTFAAIVAQSG